MGLFKKKKDEIEKLKELENNVKDSVKDAEKALDDYTKKNLCKEDIPILPIEIKEKWIWVDGYKGTDENMHCKDQQYELGTEITYNGDINLCNSGFHFCIQLKDVFNYYSINGKNRYFKVKAYVKESDYISSKNYTPLYTSVNGLRYQYGTNDTKMVTHKIEFVSEVTFAEIKQYISNFSFVENENDYKHIENYSVLANCKFTNALKDFGFDESFAIALISKFDDKEKLYDLLKFIKAIKNENVSHDLMIYMIYEESNRLYNLK